MPSKRSYQIKEVAGLSGLSVRALHHYDAIGLLVPGARTAAGYRLYDDDDQGTLWASTNYYVDSASEPGRLVLRSGVAVPSATRAANGIEILFRAGYAPDERGSPSDYRANIRHLFEPLFVRLHERIEVLEALR